MVWEKRGSVILNPVPKAVQNEFFLLEPSLVTPLRIRNYYAVGLFCVVWFLHAGGARDPIPLGPRGGCFDLRFLVRSCWQGTANSREHVSRPEVAHDRALARRTDSRRGRSSEPAELVLRRPGKWRRLEVGRL